MGDKIHDSTKVEVLRVYLTKVGIKYIAWIGIIYRQQFGSQAHFPWCPC
jgi:hypothetical protein